MEAIYTLEVARDIVDLFEDVLDKYNRAYGIRCGNSQK